ncbi:hypothetical protein EJB05_30101, partial [Eragrostis curvula]
MAEAPSTASLLPLLVFHHQPQPGHDDEMLMFSVPKQSLHERLMEHDHLAGGNNMSWTTPQGWMLIITKSSSLSSAAFLWNPLTGDKLPLPYISKEHDIPQQCKCLLSHKDPTHPACVVVLFHRTEPDMWCCRVAAGAAASYGGWRRYTYDIGDYELPESYRDPPTPRVIFGVAARQGKIYFTDTKETMGVIDFSSDDDPDFQYFNVAMVDYPEGMNSGINFLVESQDELFLVCVCFVGFDATNIGAIRAYKMDFSGEKMDSSEEQQACWRRVHDIGDFVFLLENCNMGASCAATPSGLKANWIYFMNSFIKDDATLCIFDLETEARDIAQRIRQGTDHLFPE